MSVSNRYDPQAIEEKWQQSWDENQIFACKPDGRKKYYVLEMFPYPSGNIHMGHVRNYAIGDVVARVRRMEGYNVMHPMGWDAFGLPAENAAIKNNVHPAAWTYDNISAMRVQLKRLGYSYDWNREIATCHPKYYRWEQLFFLQWLKQGLVYRKKAAQNWCPSCNTVLANEQVDEGRCWRCDSLVEQKELTQWFVRISAYVEELLADLQKLQGSWPDRVLSMQTNWIGRSEGAEICFPLNSQEGDIKVFTTRPDTLFGATFMTLAPEHPLVDGLIKGYAKEDQVRAFIEKIRNMDQLDRQSDTLEKDGIFTGAYCKNPFTGTLIPIWLGNFVLADYGTGAVMGVPAHDQRDFDFAHKFNLEIRVVVQPEGEKFDSTTLEAARTESGLMVNSAQFDGLPNEEGKKAVVAALEQISMGKGTVNWRLRDWNISRQRYWGAPIPVIYCDKCGMVPVPEKDLPVVLPLDVQTHADGRSPLPDYAPFAETTCPSCGGKARRETDTMDTFVESSWYFARFLDPRNEEQPFDPEAMKYWMPVDQYIGGVEHAILHLLYARFFTKVLRDLGYLPKELDEPFAHLLTQGMVLKDGFKMSKSKGNVVDPTQMIARYGADTVRLFCLFAAPPERDFDWSESGIEGSFRFLGRVWRLFAEIAPHLLQVKACSAPVPQSEAAKELRFKEHATTKKAGDDMGKRFQFNTGIAAIMELVNTMYQFKDDLVNTQEGHLALSSAASTVLTLLFPICPHICEELWQALGHEKSINAESWPTWQEDALQRDMFTVAVQINGKLRSTLEVPASASQEEVQALALAEDNITRHLEGLTVRKVIVVPGKIVNIVAA